jgi:tetratricopeptide (TPR) repeat protein
MAAYRRAISTMWPQREQVWAKKILGETLTELAEYCEDRGQITEAAEYYTKVVSIAPSDDHVNWALYQLGESHRKMGNLKMMQKTFEDLNKRSPDSLWARLADWSRGNAAFEGEAGPYLARAQERITRKREQ